MRVRVATFNVHHCRGSDGVVDVTRTAAVLAEAEADVIALQELDRDLPRSGHADQPAELARLLGIEVRFFPTLERAGGEYGIGIAAAHALVDLRFVPLPQLRQEEPRGVVTAAWLGAHVVATHLSTDRRARRVHLAALAALARGLEGPAIVMGDLNLGPRPLSIFRNLGYSGAFGHATLPRRFPARQIDHILVSPGVQVVDSWTIRTDASDHLPLVADLELNPGI